MSNKEYWTIVICLVLGFAIGYGVREGIINRSSGIVIAYISQEELIELEQERINRLGERDLFFGQIQRAMDLIKEIALEHKSANTKIVFSQGVVSGNGTRSIAREIHQEVIARLAGG